MGRQRWRKPALLALFVFFLAGRIWSADNLRRVELTNAQQAALSEEVIPAWQQGNPLAVLQSLSAVVSKMDEARIQAVDAALEDQGLPAAGEMLAHARLVLVEQNLATALPKPEPREIVLTLGAILDKIAATLAEINKDSALAGGQIPQNNLREYEDLFWRLHVLDNRLETTGRLASYARRLAATARVPKKNLTEVQQNVLSTDVAKIERDVFELRKKLKDRELDHRVARLAFASQKLTSTHDLKEKFLAAHVLDLDGELLAAQLEIPNSTATKKSKTSKSRVAEVSESVAIDKELNPITGMSAEEKSFLAERVREHITVGRKAAGEDLFTKSRLLFTGLHWWYRGRYGASSEGNGLLKPRQALSSPQSMFALYMPTKTAVPNDPLVPGPQVPQVDRRHHYAWQFETRRIKAGGDFQPESTSTSSSTTITKFDVFW